MICDEITLLCEVQDLLLAASKDQFDEQNVIL